MRTSKLIALCLCACVLCSCGAQQVGQPGKPSILAIGDSISGGWVLPLMAKLKYEYDVRRVTADGTASGWIDNCRNTTYTLNSLDGWLKYWPNNSIIIWNNGIWNAAPVTPGQPYQYYYTPPDQYQSELIQIAKKLKATGSRVIFLTTTELSPSDTRATVGLNTQFNDIAKTVLPPLGIEVRDLWDFTIDHADWHPTATDLHFGGIANEYIGDWLTMIVHNQPVDNGVR